MSNHQVFEDKWSELLDQTGAVNNLVSSLWPQHKPVLSRNTAEISPCVLIIDGHKETADYTCQIPSIIKNIFNQKPHESNAIDVNFHKMIMYNKTHFLLNKYINQIHPWYNWKDFSYY